MKKVAIFILTTLFFSCNHQDCCINPNIVKKFYLFEIVLDMQNERVLYLSFYEDKDSLVVFSSRNEPLRDRIAFKLTTTEMTEFKSIVLKHLCLSTEVKQQHKVFGGVKASFSGIGDNYSISVEFDDLTGFNSVSDDFFSYYGELRTKYKYIDSLCVN